jgi:hypothetical protein
MVARERDSTQRPEDLTDGDILSMPLASVPSFMLTEVWARHATLQSSRDFAQFNREQDDAYAGPRRFSSQAAVDRKHAAQREERQHALLRAQQRFQEAMQDIRNRTDDLLRRITQQEELAQQRLAEIRRRAIVLADGRRIYVGNDGTYLGEDGQVLGVNDAAEARAKHAVQPDAATWDEKTAFERRSDELRRMNQDVVEFRESVDNGNADGLTAQELDELAERHEKTLAVYEAGFHARFEAAAPAGLARDYGSADYMAAYTTSFAGTLDPKRPGLRDEFKPAAAAEDPAQPSAPGPGTPVPRGPSL